MAQSSPAVSPQDLAAGYAALAAAYAQAAAEEEAEGEVPTDLVEGEGDRRWLGWDDGVFSGRGNCGTNKSIMAARFMVRYRTVQEIGMDDAGSYRMGWMDSSQVVDLHTGCHTDGQFYQGLFHWQCNNIFSGLPRADEWCWKTHLIETSGTWILKIFKDYCNLSDGSQKLRKSYPKKPWSRLVNYEISMIPPDQNASSCAIGWLPFSISVMDFRKFQRNPVIDIECWDHSICASLPLWLMDSQRKGGRSQKVKWILWTVYSIWRVQWQFFSDPFIKASHEWTSKPLKRHPTIEARTEQNTSTTIGFQDSIQGSITTPTKIRETDTTIQNRPLNR